MERKKKKHVLFLSYHLPLGDEPGAFRPWMEARLMTRAGFAVTVITCGVQYMTGKDIRPYKGWCTSEVRDDIRILRTWAPADHRRSLLRRTLNYLSYTVLAGFIALLKVGHVDRVFAGTDPIFMMPMVYLVSRIKSAGLVLDERDLFPETAIALGVIREGILSRILFSMQQFFRRKSIALFATTPGIREKLIGYGHPQDKLFLLYNADVFIEEDLKGGSSQFSLREQTGRDFLIGYAGGLGKANDIPTLLRAAAYLRDLGDAGILVIGSGERQKEYKDYCVKYGLNNVFFFDAVPRHEVRQLMLQFDVCVHLYPDADLFRGALASKIFDYHGVGRPVVFCGGGDTATLLAESGGGIVVVSGDDRGLADALRGLYLNEEQRHFMGQSAQQWFKKHIGLEASVSLFCQSLNCGNVLLTKNDKSICERRE